MGWLNRIFKMWPDERFVQGETHFVGKGREESFQVLLKGTPLTIEMTRLYVYNVQSITLAQ